MDTKFSWLAKNDMGKKQKKRELPQKTAFQGRQLDLFQDFLCNTPEERERLSNTIELWDVVPKYHINRRRQAKLRENGFLPTAEKNFVYRGKELTVKIRPARITVDNKDKEFYPAAREELVEDALRKMAGQPGYGYLDDNRSGVKFTLHQLRNELKKTGHTMSYYQLTESLDILSSTTIEIAPLHGKAIHKTHPLNSIIGVSQDDLKNDPASKWYVDFSAPVTEGMRFLKYRQYDYTVNMKLKKPLSRYIHKRMCLNYIQASMLDPYSISMQGLASNTGFLESARAYDNCRKIEESLKELIDSNVISFVERKEVRGKRKSLIDVHFTI